MKHVLFALLLLFAILFLLVSPARADNPINFSNSSFVNKFPQNLVFQVDAQSSAKITQVALMIQIGSCVTNRFSPTFTPDTNIQAMYQWDLGQNYLPPGVSGQFWWTLQDSAGNQLATPKQTFRIDDPAHTWQKLSNNQLALYWYSGGQDFGQALYQRGLQAISFLQQDIGVQLDQQVQIFIYANHDDLMQSLSVGAQEWTGGQDFPDYSVVLIGVDPSNLDWGLGATAHELTHQVVHHAIQNGCSSLGSLSLPPLMDEGLAVYNQDPGQPDPQFTPYLRRAIQNNTLISLRSLTSAFPANPDAASLSYGESWSFVDFLIRHYGKAKLGDWLKAVKVGGTIDDLFQQVYGKNLDQLEAEWRQDIGAQPRVVPTQNPATPSPFPTFGLSTGDTPVPSTGGTATPAAVVVNATPVPPPASAPSAPANPLSSACGGVFGFMAFGILGAVLWKRWHLPNV
jgi:hypothetical protein